MSPPSITIPAAAAQLDAPAWLVRRLADALCQPLRAGLYRLLTEDDVRRVREELERRKAVRSA